MISPLRGGDIPPCGRYEGTLRSFKKLSGRFLQWIQLCRFGKAVWKKAVKPSGTFFNQRPKAYLHIERREIYHAPIGRISFIICRRHISFQHMYPRREPEAGENPGVMGSAAAVVVAAAAPAAAAAAVVAGVGAPSAAADEEKDDDQDPAAVTVVTTHIAVPPFG